MVIETKNEEIGSLKPYCNREKESEEMWQYVCQERKQRQFRETHRITLVIGRRETCVEGKKCRRSINEIDNNYRKIKDLHQR